MTEVGAAQRGTVGGTEGSREDGQKVGTLPSRRLLVSYRVMAYTTGVLLIVLVFVGVPLQVAAGRPQVVNVVGTMHGFLYIVYLVLALALTWRLRIAKWKMLLVLLAGTVPFCGFVAERKMTRRFEVVAGTASPATGADAGRRGTRERASELRRRWLSPRALVLHAEVLVVAPACVLAGWWQATQALAGNELSWVYSVEWPIFALIAVWAWWHLVHEDVAAYRARRWRTAVGDGADAGGADPDPATSASGPAVDVERGAVQWAAVLSVAVWFEFALGWLTLVLVPFGRPSGWLPARGVDAYGMHASVGVVVVLGALAFLFRARAMGRTARIVAWTGAVSLAVAGAGGLLTAEASLDRIFGVLLMFAGSALAGAAYLVPVVVQRRSRRQVATTTPPVAGSAASDAPGIGAVDAG